jgi:hypothetical protein
MTAALVDGREPSQPISTIVPACLTFVAAKARPFSHAKLQHIQRKNPQPREYAGPNGEPRMADYFLFCGEMEPGSERQTGQVDKSLKPRGQTTTIGTLQVVRGRKRKQVTPCIVLGLKTVRSRSCLDQGCIRFWSQQSPER